MCQLLFLRHRVVNSHIDTLNLVSSTVTSLLTFNRAEVELGSITRVLVCSQAPQQGLLLDLLHIQRVGFKSLQVPFAEPTDRLHRQILRKQTTYSPVFTLHLRANIPPNERHPRQRADTNSRGQKRRHPCCRNRSYTSSCG